MGSRVRVPYAPQVFFRFIKITGALVQLVRIHACHAWGHGFESRTHRWDSRTTESLKATKSTISMNCGLFLYSASANPRTSNSPLRTKFRYQIVTEKLPSDYCNDFHANSLICPLLSQFCLLIIQLITFPLWHCVTIVTKDIKTDAFMSKSTFKILFYLRKNYVWKSHSTLTLLATQNYPFLLKYDCPLWLK